MTGSWLTSIFMILSTSVRTCSQQIIQCFTFIGRKCPVKVSMVSVNIWKICSQIYRQIEQWIWSICKAWIGHLNPGHFTIQSLRSWNPDYLFGVPRVNQLPMALFFVHKKGNSPVCLAGRGGRGHYRALCYCHWATTQWRRKWTDIIGIQTIS